MLYDYELYTVLPGTLAETEVPDMLAKIQETLEKNGAQDVLVKNMGKSRLAYPMKHIRYGYITLFYFNTEKAGVEVLQQKLALIPQLLRKLIRRFDAEATGEEDVQEILKEFGRVAKKDDKKAPKSAPKKEKPAVKEEKKDVVPEEGAPTSEKSEEAAPNEDAEEKKDKEDKKEAVSMEEIEQKLDDILESSLQ